MRPESYRPFLRWAWIFCLLALVALPIQAQTLTITKVTDINAGSVVAPSSGTATYTLTYAGVRSISPGYLGSTAGLTLGSFTIAGRNNRSFTLSDNSATAVDMTGPSSNTVKITGGSWPSSPSVLPVTTAMKLGVKITIASTATRGTYTGTYTLKVTDSSNNTDTQIFTVTVLVTQVIGITSSAGLDFGDVFRGPSAGTVLLTAAGVRTSSLTLGALHAVSAAAFTVTGGANATYAITLPTSITLTGPAGSTAMTVDTFTSNPGSTGTLSSGGTQVLTVGASLDVGANQADGDYNGTFTVTVTYN